MPTRRTLLLSGASTVVSTVITALLSPRAMAVQRRLKPLQPGSRIRAVNPGTWMDPDTDLQALRERCDQQQWHLEIPATVTRQWRYFSGTDQERVQDLRSAWNDPTVDAVVTVGGGWGAARVLEAGFRFPRRPKWSLGFADISSLLLAQWAAGLPGAIHGSSGGTDAQWERTVDLLCGRPVVPLQGEPRRRGNARGPLVVTNLTIATHLIGTPWLPSLKGAILVLEDVGEAPYRVDRMLTQWRSAGLLQHLAGVPAVASAGPRTTSCPAISRWRRSWKNAWGIWASHWCSICRWAMDNRTKPCPWDHRPNWMESAACSA